MSALRRNDRRAARNVHSSPYARPKQPNSKKSVWSLSGLLGYLNPMRFRSSTTARADRGGDVAMCSDEQVNELPPDPPSEPWVNGLPPGFNLPPDIALVPPPLAPTSPAQTLSARGRQMAQNINLESDSGPLFTPTRPSQSAFNFNTPPSQMPSSLHRPSLAKTLEPITKFLVEKSGKPMDETEAANIVDFIQQSVRDEMDKPEPFRFSTTPSRDTSPSNTNEVPSQIPRRTLSKNPNGVYKWQGAGSARPRNRYQSPAFGSRPSPSRIKLSPPKTPQTDMKRRRVGDAAETSIPQRVPANPVTPPRAQAPAPSPTRITMQPSLATPSKPPANGTSSTTAGQFSAASKFDTPRLRTNVPVKPTAPAVPSPLRQAWGQSDSPPSGSPPSRATKAASFMTNLIKEVTPPKKADVSNPYQTASPVKPPTKIPTAKRMRPTRSTEAERKRTEKEKSKEKEPEPSVQTIIESTVPKGSKRARPPPEIETTQLSLPAAAVSPPRRSPRSKTSELPSINGSSRVGRALKVATPVPAPAQESDEDSRSPKKPKTSVYDAPRYPRPRPAFSAEVIEDRDMPAYAALSIVKEAEVIEVNDEEESSTRPNNNLMQPTAVKPPFALKSSAPKEPSKLRFSYQVEKTETQSSSQLSTTSTPTPASVFDVDAGHSPKEPTLAPKGTDPKSVVLAMTVDSLPKYTFTLGAPSYDAGPSHSKAREAAKAAPLPSLPMFDFSKPVTATLNGFNWTAAGMKAPTANSKPAAPASKGIDWAAAGVKPPPQEGWSCSTCMDPGAREKCTVCEAARSKPMTAPAVVEFDWAAAGMNPTLNTSGGTWTCSTCMLSNPATATEKCTVCDTPR